MDVVIDYIPTKIQNMVLTEAPIQTANVGNQEVQAVFFGDMQIYG
jgi:hypothetical protein